jgi:hypothetical protein
MAIRFGIFAAGLAVAASALAAAQENGVDTKARPRIINIVNFIRAVEPRMDMDLLKPVVEQIKLVRKHNLPATFLMQYDAMLDDRFVSLLKKELPENCEIGGWFEVVQPQVEAVGLPWRGRYPWDWHAEVGFSVGYTPEERDKLVDEFMRKFKEVFGRYPVSVGSWFFDAHTLAYMADKYSVRASCNCKDQYGTDGYTLWGGYWNQAYYPSRTNAFMPAQSADQQIPMPVFRMLGSDPIYQYDLDIGSEAQKVVTLEPVYLQAGGGGHTEWVKWFFDAMVNDPCVTFAYAQAGQENSFGWERMGDGLTFQCGEIARLRDEGRFRVETLGESADWFRKTYPVTPASAVVATKDWKEKGRKSAWYDSRFYRTSLLWEDNALRIRDIHLFDAKYAERYLKEKVTTNWCIYDTLPVVDGYRWSTEKLRAGMRLVNVNADGATGPLKLGEPVFSDAEAGRLRVECPAGIHGNLRIACDERAFELTLDGADWALEYSWDASKATPLVSVNEKRLLFRNELGFEYALRSEAGIFSRTAENTIMIKPELGRVCFDMDTTDNAP